MTEVTQPEPPQATPPLQPLLHDLASSVAAPGLLLGAADGQLRRGGVSGWYVGDLRLLDTVELAVEGSGLDLVRSDPVGADRQEFSYVARALGDQLPDPTVRVDRVRELGDAGFVETLVVESVAQLPVELVLQMTLGTDLAPMATVKRGGAAAPLAASGSGSGLRWSVGEVTVEVAGDPVPEVDAPSGRITWPVQLSRGERRELRLRATTDARGPFGGGRPSTWAASVDSADPSIRRTAEQSLADLGGLLLADDGDRFLAAGSPWFLTLFGRDSLWAARMLVPFDPGLALSTLRVLARRQGTRSEPETEEQPGKILHEVRGAELDLGAQVLPAVYYGSVDATPLFVLTLADAHAWGGDHTRVRELLPAARGCLTWLMDQTRDGGWIRYLDHTGRGLSNQGWKDSHDSVQFADGRLAEPPIALCEVQAYAYEAAVRGASLLAAYDAEPVPGLEAWAEDLRDRFGRQFWVGSPGTGHVAIALDADGRPVDSVTSNMGHLLGTGLLGRPHADRVADLLADSRMDSGFGLRTLATDSPRFSRLSYHGGTVWPHDTAIAVRGLAAEGRFHQAARLAHGLFTAAEGFGHRLPELYGGDAAGEVSRPSAYPAACRPQAWSAAAPLAALVAVSGVGVDAAAGVIRHPARTSAELSGFALRGLSVAGGRMDVAVDHDGRVHVEVAGTPLSVEVVEE